MLIALIALTASLPPNPTAGRKLVFSCDFAHQQTLDPKQWRYDNGPVYNHELEKYTSSNTRFEDGALVIEARKEGSKITSARLQSVPSWKYVYVESVAKVPTGKGTWPAIWMLNDRLRNPDPAQRVEWPRCGEIDIMENVGFDPKNFHFTLHCEAFSSVRNNQRTEVTPVSNPQDFHTYGMDWRPDKITFYLDRKPVYTVFNKDDTVEAWPFRETFYLILNLAIGGDWGGREGVDDAIFPSKFLIRSVKVYQ